MNNIDIEIKNYTFRVGNFVLEDIDFSIDKGEVFAILGTTGSGKTVLLESIAGFNKGAEGHILVNGENISKVPIEDRNIGYVYQNYILFPHLSVYDNIAYGLKIKTKNKEEVRKRVIEIAKDFMIEGILNQYPDTLSGGEKQRASMARALVLEPDVLLLDEPFNALDQKTKREVYNQIESVRNKYSCTIIIVTHDFNEAVNIADRIAIILKGKLKRICLSEELLQKHDDEDVNKFLNIHL